MRSFIKTFGISILVCWLFVGNGKAYIVDVEKTKVEIQKDLRDKINKLQEKINALKDNIYENPNIKHEILEYINIHSSVCGTLIRIADQQYMDIYKRAPKTNKKIQDSLREINNHINAIKIGRGKEFGKLKNQTNLLEVTTTDGHNEIKGDTVMHYNLMYNALIKILMWQNELDREMSKVQ